ncbi:MAG TPA: hypothetical protein DDZ96_10700 [Porphyromonadaceae bacterium]|jgi:hypothetical protein|nr:hypothetical protein [Porphyromonadaceae bacterium]HBX19939.1 hypothetical protein [Porphyromonadaceae bacterium]HCM21680.1 hypothetical protein [Porphyromonadaceae bacterium]
MKTKLLLYFTLIISVFSLSCSDKYISEDTNHFIKVNQRKITIVVGENYRIVPIFDSEETASKNFNWSVADAEIASISSATNHIGIVKGIAPGKTVIEVISDDKQQTYYVDLEVTNEPKTIKILTIGNSFSEDAVENYLYDLAKADGNNILIGNMYIGGCSLEQHWKNASENKSDYQFRKIDRNGMLNRIDNMTIYEAVKNENWDYISFQEVSQLSGIIDSYREYLPQLVEFVEKFATNPDVKYVLHQTWAYSEDSNHEGFNNYDKEQVKMYNAIVDAVNKAADLANIGMIVPSGTAIQNGRTSYLGDRFTRDGFHLDLGVGRFTAACTWYESIFGGILENLFLPNNLLIFDAELAKQAAYDAVKHPKQITDMIDFKERGPNEFVLEHPLFIDFGPIFTPEPFNNFARWQDGSVPNLKDESGNNTGFIIKTGLRFHDGVIERGMENLLGFPKTVSQDAFFNDGRVYPQGSSLILSNLNKEKKYSFVLYATINDKGTQTEYRIKGRNEGVGYLDTDHNLSKVVAINDIVPDDNGEITILIKQGPNNVQYWGYYGLNAMIVLPEGETFAFPVNNFELKNPVLIDFGLRLSGSPFVNLQDPWAPQDPKADPVLNMEDKDGVNTGFAIAITGGFSAVNDLGVLDNSLGLPYEVAVDAFWGDKWMPEGELTVSNLNKSQKYDFIFYGSHRDVSDNRETKYEVIGENSGFGLLNTSNNAGSVVVVKGIVPDAARNIVIKVSAGPNNNSADGLYYLNTLILGPEGFKFSGM